MLKRLPPALIEEALRETDRGLWEENLLDLLRQKRRSIKADTLLRSARNYCALPPDAVTSQPSSTRPSTAFAARKARRPTKCSWSPMTNLSGQKRPTTSFKQYQTRI